MNLVKYDNRLAITPTGFKNNGVICYFNSMLQSLFSCTSFINILFKINKKNNIENPVFKCLLDLAEMHIELKNNINDTNSINIKNKIEKMSIILWKQMVIKIRQKNKAFSFNGQQCAGEGFNHLLESLDDIQEIQNLFTHKYNTNLFCFDCERWVSKVDNTYNLFNIDAQLHIQQLDEFKNFDKREREIFGKLYNIPNLSELNKYLIKQNTYVDKDYKCTKCEKKGEKYKLNYLVMVPEILVVMSKKYNNSMRKQNVFTDFPEKLSFSGNNKNILNYTAVSQIEHSGGLNGGHYWSISKRKDGWYNCNDLSISASQFKPTNNTYIVFYHLE